MRLVAIESPYAGNVEDNVHYLGMCILDCLRRGEAPFASHGLYPGPLDDDKPTERALGIRAGFEWSAVASVRVVYTDLGISPGMQLGIDAAHELGQAIEYRTIPTWPPA